MARGSWGFLAALVLGTLAAAPGAVTPDTEPSVPVPDNGLSIFVPAWGFEEDVDLVVSPFGDFVVVPEETADGADARVRILELDDEGAPVALSHEDEVLGWEGGVDPIVIWTEVAAPDFVVLLPVESADGMEAELLVLGVDEVGALVASVDIDLGDLGFVHDVDGIWNAYTGSLAFFALESANGEVRGVLAIDVDLVADPDWGDCLLLSTDGRAVCDVNEAADYLPGLADGVDPLAYPIGDRLRLALPVASDDGNDLLFLDFDNDVFLGDLPIYFGHTSVKEANAAGPRVLTFPGYEQDVDLVHLPEGQCADSESLLVPVEGPDEADLYRIDAVFATALWTFNLDSSSTDLTILGYEIGVDLLTLCGLAVDPPNRVAVPVEDAEGASAGLWIVDIDGADLLAQVEDPALNPDVSIPGYEIGVDLVRWTEGAFVAAVEGADEDPGLVVVHPDGTAADSLYDPNFLGYRRSVDLLVSPTSPLPSLVVPMGADDGSDTDLLVYSAPPFLGAGYDLEDVNVDLELPPFAFDVDLGLVDKTTPGELYVCVPEESPDGAFARLRFELTAGLPDDRVLAMATEAEPAAGLPATFYLVDIPTGDILIEKDDLLGLPAGLDLTTGNGPARPREEPLMLFPRPTGLDDDGDPARVTTVREMIVDIDPDTINLKSKGKWVTAYLTLPRGFDVRDIDVGTVRLNDVVPAAWGEVQGDALMVKFPAAAVRQLLLPGDDVEIRVRCELIEGTLFEGSDVVRVIQPGK